jgi:hypothetical protein
MKTQIRNLAKIVLASSALIMATSCQKDYLEMGSQGGQGAQYASIIDVATDGTTTIVDTRLKLAIVETADADTSEINGLVQLKDDEKLARDVYSALNAKWNSTVFANISSSESRHLTAITLLLGMYSPADTAITAPGVFSNAVVQKLYDDLIALGTTSLADAYKVGATIEDLDISDIASLSSKTTNANITMVYDNLSKGSRNHLRAFSRELKTLGITYVPQYISQTDYDQIISTSFEKGKQYRMKGQNGNGMGYGNGQGNGNGKGNKGQGKQGGGSCNM